MLTLLLVLGAVTCSPVPSDLPAFPDAAHVEVTHEVRQVTYEVSEEVNEATASSHIPSDVPPEEDPPIPTVTTPHTTPEEQHPQDGVTESDVADQPQGKGPGVSQEVSTELEVTVAESLSEETDSHEKKTLIEPKDTTTEVESENLNSSEKSKEAVDSSSSESFELEPERHVFLPSEDANDSQSESTTESLPPSKEQPISESSVALINSGLIALNRAMDAAQTDSQVNADLVEALATSEATSHENPDSVDEVHDPVSDENGHAGGEEVLEIPSQIMHDTADSEFLETEKRIDTEDLPAEEDVEESASGSSEDVAIITPGENVPETTRESRVYIDYEDEKSVESQEGEEESTHTESESMPAKDGLESMSMTSPTPESLPGDVPIVDDLEKDEAPPADDQQEEAATVLPEMESQEENSTMTASVEEPDVVPEVVINPPSSSVAPPPLEEFTDHYNDPLVFGDLPDFEVTHEQLPSKDNPLPEEAQLIPGKTHDHTGEVSERESSDLAAGDHMLEVEAGTPRVLPPQQEQVSAAAPSALTPGCIVAIVFGVLVSLVVILGAGGFMVWQRRTQNRPKVLGNDQGYAGSDSGGYIDDQVRVSYVNSQTDTPKGSPEDLISLDNDSFLNSLESMTIQNLWTDNIRHTKL